MTNFYIWTFSLSSCCKDTCDKNLLIFSLLSVDLAWQHAVSPGQEYFWAHLLWVSAQFKPSNSTLFLGNTDNLCECGCICLKGLFSLSSLTPHSFSPLLSNAPLLLPHPHVLREWEWSNLIPLHTDSHASANERTSKQTRAVLASAYVDVILVLTVLSQGWGVGRAHEDGCLHSARPMHTGLWSVGAV